MSNDAIQIEQQVQQQLAVLSSTAGYTAVLAGGVYDVWCDVDVFINVSPPPGAAVTAANGYPVFAGNVVPVEVNPGSRIGAIAVSGSGTLKYHRVGG